MFNSHHSRELLICSLNDNLEATALAIYKSFFVDFEPFDFVQPESWEEVTIEDTIALIMDYVNERKNPSADFTQQRDSF